MILHDASPARRSSRGFAGVLAQPLIVGLVAALALAVSLLGAGPVAAAEAVSHYDTAAYAYDAPAQQSSTDTAASYAWGSRSGPGAASWGRSVFSGAFVVAAETGAGAAESGVACTLSAAEQRSVASLQRQVAAHTEKLEAYRANPDAFDNLCYLERAPSPEIRQRIPDGRINHLETEIRGLQDQIDKLLGDG